MAGGAILYVGDDVHRRVSVMKSAGITVLRSKCSIGGVRRSLTKGDVISAITFHNDIVPPEEEVVLTAREFSRAPLILFRNPLVDCDERLFDMVMPMASVEVWAKSLQTAVKESRELHEYSRGLREDSAAVRYWSQTLRETSKRICKRPIDADVIFRPGVVGSEDGDS